MSVYRTIGPLGFFWPDQSHFMLFIYILIDQEISSSCFGKKMGDLWKEGAIYPEN